MRKALTITILIGITFLGCGDTFDDNPISTPIQSEKVSNSIENLPEIPDSIEVIPWPYPPGADTIFTGLGLPESEIPNLVVSEVINGQDGGQIIFNYEYEISEGNMLSIWAWLNIRPGAFDGEKEISIVFNHQIAAVSFYPHMGFNGIVDFEIEYNGLDLSGIDPNSVDFLFQNHDGSTEHINYDYITVIPSTGRLFLDDGELNHFSRYGFVN